MPYFMFIDEAYPESSEYAQISGFLIHVNNYKQLRYVVLSKYLLDRQTKNPMETYDSFIIPLYKWNDFLPNENDDAKEENLDFLYRTIYLHSDMVFCYGIHGPLPFIKETWKYDLLNHCWNQLQFVVNKFQIDDSIIPVIDLGHDNGFKKQYKLYAQQNYSALNIKILNGENSCSLKMPENLLEPLFSTDEYSIGVQLADIVGGLQLFNSKKRSTLTPFNTQRKLIIEQWYNHPKTLCIFESWVQDGLSAHSEYHDSRFNGKEYKVITRSEDASLYN